VRSSIFDVSGTGGHPLQRGVVGKGRLAKEEEMKVKGGSLRAGGGLRVGEGSF